MVSSEVSSRLQRFPVSSVRYCTGNLGNFCGNLALGAAIQGFLLWKRFQGRKPKVSSRFPSRFPNRGSRPWL